MARPTLFHRSGESASRIMSLHGLSNPTCSETTLATEIRFMHVSGVKNPLGNRPRRDHSPYVSNGRDRHE